MRAIGGVWCAIPVALSLCAAVASAQETTDWQAWPEADIWVRTGARTRLFFLATVTTQQPSSLSYSEGQFGVHLDITLKSRWFGVLRRVSQDVERDRRQMASARLGYRYGSTQDEDGTWSHENRGIIELTFRRGLPGAVLLSDRTRFDLRWLDGEYSTRVRNRLMAEWDARLFNKTLTPYGSAELYYDTRYKTTNRSRFIFGIQTPVTRALMFDVYFARQNDTRAELTHVNAIGVVLNVSY